MNISKQTTIQPVSWQVGEGVVTNESTGEKVPARLVIFADPMTDEVYVFPLPEDEGRRMGDVLSSDDPDAEMVKVHAARRLKISHQPSEAELRATAAQAAGGIQKP